MTNQDNQHYIYLRSTRERIPCTEQEFHDYYRDINAYRQKQQYHGKCVCPERKRLDCDMDCATCPFVETETCLLITLPGMLKETDVPGLRTPPTLWRWLM